ncbi:MULTISPECIES: hypervirulence associated TUDOR domain-containing protein [unclassified Gordonia (in: high G+C Gram-positive bacteria)]|uniref:DUF2945 domain-containing protein n=1 Tax=Gordonia sp. VNQ95 TaxID=3156619 RepID=UPI0032B5FD09
MPTNSPSGGWRSSRRRGARLGETAGGRRQHGTAREKRSSPFTFDGQKFDASDGEPFWIVESDKTGAKAAYKESSLTKK